MPRAKKDVILPDGDTEMSVPEVNEEPKVEIVAESAPVETKSDVKSDEEGIAELKKRLQESEEARTRVERERNEAVQRAYHARNETEDTNLRLIESAIQQVAANSSILEGNYAAALAEGDTARAAKIMREMAANEAKALQLENGKQSLKERPKDAPKPLDPVEALASQLSPRSAAWVRSHPEYATNQRLTQKMVAAHNLAVADGLVVDTDPYFEAVEDILKVSQRAPTRAVQDEDDGDEPFSQASTPVQTRRSPPAAIPVSREVSTSGQRQRTVRLTPQEVEAAELSNLTPQEYYENKRALESERTGRLN